jgi:septal ring factor EnvC (AmiA/AmiB activator)
MDIVKKLHDKFSRGETLTAKEQKILDNWYTRQDAAESKTLRTASKKISRVQLQEQIDSTLSRLTVVTRQIQKVASENDVLRRDISTLRRQLVRQLETQSV